MYLGYNGVYLGKIFLVMDCCLLDVLLDLGTQHEQLNIKKEMVCVQIWYKYDYHLHKDVIENYQHISPQIFQMVF